jgi:hypothetical protein
LERFLTDENFGAEVEFGPNEPEFLLMSDPSVDIDEEIDNFDRYMNCETVHHPDPKFIGSEVGDDVTTISNSSLALKCQLIAIQIFLRMELSTEDTFVSARVVNFTEDTMLLPRSLSETWEVLYRSNAMGNIPVTDVTRLRILSLASKENQDESTTPEGKIAAIAAWTKTMTPYSRNLRLFAILLQDIQLGVIHEGRPKYLPFFLGGLNVEVVGGGKNLFRFLKSWLGGRQRRLYHAIFTEIVWQVDLWKRGLERPESFFSDRILAQSKSEKLVGKLVHELDPSDKVGVAYVTSSSDDDPYTASVCRRLYTQRVLIPEVEVVSLIGADIIREAIHSGYESGLQKSRLDILVRSSRARNVINNIEAQPLLENFWRDNPYGKEARRLYGVELAESELSETSCIEVYNYLYASALDIELILKKTRWYETRVIDELLTPMSWRVFGVQFQLLGHRDIAVTTKDDPDVGLDEWCLEALIDLKEGTPVNPEFVNDDGQIWQRCWDFLKTSRKISWRQNPKDTVLIVSNDVRLCRDISEQMGLTVIRMPTEICLYLETVHTTPEYVVETNPYFKQVGLIIRDTGSLNSAKIRFWQRYDKIEEVDLIEVLSRDLGDDNRYTVFHDRTYSLAKEYAHWPQPFHVLRRGRFDRDRIRERNPDQPRYTWKSEHSFLVKDN